VQARMARTIDALVMNAEYNSPGNAQGLGGGQ
jgi:hypothetical protein